MIDSMSMPAISDADKARSEGRSSLSPSSVSLRSTSLSGAGMGPRDSQLIQPYRRHNSYGNGDGDGVQYVRSEGHIIVDPNQSHTEFEGAFTSLNRRRSSYLRLRRSELTISVRGSYLHFAISLIFLVQVTPSPSPSPSTSTSTPTSTSPSPSSFSTALHQCGNATRTLSRYHRSDSHRDLASLWSRRGLV